jgi:hypothetical protein
MIVIRKLDYQSYAKTVDNRSRVTAEIFVDEVSDLPETNGIDGYTLCMGSIAYVITTGELYVLGSDGKWYNGENITAETKEGVENGS